MNEAKQLDLSNAIAYLQDGIEAQRQEKSVENFSVTLIQKEPQSIEKSASCPLQKGVFTTTEISFLIYMKTPKE